MALSTHEPPLVIPKPKSINKMELYQDVKTFVCKLRLQYLTYDKPAKLPIPFKPKFKVNPTTTVNDTLETFIEKTPHPDNQQGPFSSNTDPNHENQTQSQTDWVPKIDYNLLCLDSTSTTPAQTPTQNLTDYIFNQSKTDMVGKKGKTEKIHHSHDKLFYNQQFMAMALEREHTPRLSLNCTLLAATDQTGRECCRRLA